MSLSPVPDLKRSLAIVFGDSIPVPTGPDGDGPPVEALVRFEPLRFDATRLVWVLVTTTPGVVRTVVGHRVRQQIDVYATDPTGALGDRASSEIERLLTERPKGPDGGLVPGTPAFVFTSIRKALHFTRQEEGPGGVAVFHSILDFEFGAQEKRLTGTRF